MKDDPRFLKNIDNSDLYWFLEFTGGKTVCIKVISYISTTKGEPITLYVMNKSGLAFEIPWTAIQTIRLDRAITNGN